jgi:hypothetical protein
MRVRVRVRAMIKVRVRVRTTCSTIETTAILSCLVVALSCGGLVLRLSCLALRISYDNCLVL